LGQGGTKSSIAETTQNQGGRGGTGVQGIGLAIEKNKISFSEEPSLEKISTVALTSVLEGGQCECRVDSCNLVQDKVNQDECADSPVDPKQGNLPFYQRADGQIEIDKLAIADSTPINAIAPKDDIDHWMTPEELQSMAAALDSCEDSEALALLRECWLPKR
jgi:hypothetical protein